MAVGDKYRRGEMALRVLHSLPAQHEKYFYQEIRRRCMNQMASLGVPLAERSSAAGELLSEVMAKLLGVGSSSGAESDAQRANQYRARPLMVSNCLRRHRSKPTRMIPERMNASAG